MRPGLSADDIYIMVDDEFLSTAQLFTSHLHHAEYRRLRKLAAARSSSTASALDQRPTDSITLMRAETLKKKQAEAKAGKNKVALEQMKKDARGGIAVSDHSDDLDEEDSDADAAPWVGTSLQGLMAPDARKKKNLTSLSGLHGIKSSTRAAKGYEMKVDESPVRSRSQRGQVRFDDDGKSTYRIPLFDVATSSEDDDDDNDDDDNDDLDAPIARRRRPPPPPKSRPQTKPPAVDPNARPSNPLTLAADDLFQPTRPPPKSTTINPGAEVSPPSKHNRLGSSPRSKDDAAAAAARRRAQARRDRATAIEKRRREEEEGGNIHEIPVFLV